MKKVILTLTLCLGFIFLKAQTHKHPPDSSYSTFIHHKAGLLLTLGIDTPKLVDTTYLTTENQKNVYMYVRYIVNDDTKEYVFVQEYKLVNGKWKEYAYSLNLLHDPFPFGLKPLTGIIGVTSIYPKN